MNNIIGTRGITVNVFDNDDESDIALRLINAVLEEYKDRTEENND